MNMQVYQIEYRFSQQATIKILNIMPTDFISGKKHENTGVVSIYFADENIWHNNNVFFLCCPMTTQYFDNKNV